MIENKIKKYLTEKEEEEISTKLLPSYKETKNVKVCGVCVHFYTDDFASDPCCGYEMNREELLGREVKEDYRECLYTSPFGYCKKFKSHWLK